MEPTHLAFESFSLAYSKLKNVFLLHNIKAGITFSLAPNVMQRLLEELTLMMKNSALFTCTDPLERKNHFGIKRDEVFMKTLIEDGSLALK